jgi:CDP-diacylglycerol pyrophosphatase
MLARLLAGLCAVGLVAAPTLTAPTAAADPNALWTIVDGKCVPDQQRSGDPAPCALVDPDAGGTGGYAVLKDLVGKTQFLVIPTDRIAGIESPEVLAPNATNYFEAAWRARTFVEQRAGQSISRDWMGLTVNSAQARTQNQLHVHVDCVRADVRDALARHPAGPTWAPFPEPLAGQTYDAMTVIGDDLDAVNPFVALADGIPGARTDMGVRTLAAVGTYQPDGTPAFVLLTNAAGTQASSEDLQDHDSCPPPRGTWAK